MGGGNNTGHTVFAHITIGLQLAITILIFVYAGYRLDLYFAKSPLFLLIGTALGMGLGFYHLMKDLNSENKKEEKNKNKGNKKKIRWN